jgi:hypothetical protein
MEQKKPRGKAPKPVAQLDPETFEVIKEWPSRGAAESGTGACNLDRCIAKMRKSAGYYWCDPQDAKTFEVRLAMKEVNDKCEKADKKTKEEKSVLDATPASVAEPAATPKFKVGDHVWAKQPKELYGRTGYVTGVDARSRMYDVTYLGEIWKVREDDLELVNEPVMGDYITKRMPESLADYTNNELLAEIKRRGWKGNITMSVTVEL